tara:strand:+ start:269 stop:676 length:408 start_codon:yes stop_codon:yes gene_type:complete
MSIEVNVQELANILAHNKIVQKYEGRIPIYEDIIDEFVGQRYTKECQKEFNKLYKKYWELIKDHVVYPFREGDSYWTVHYAEDSHQYHIIESCWDDVSEEKFMENPDKILFRTKFDAIKHLKTIGTENYIIVPTG